MPYVRHEMLPNLLHPLTCRGSVTVTARVGRRGLHFSRAVASSATWMQAVEQCPSSAKHRRLT